MPIASPRVRACARLALLASALVSWLAPFRLRADSREESLSSLHWVRLGGSEACIGSLELARAVEGRLGRSVFVSAARAELAVEGHVAPTAAGFLASISVSRADGTVVGTRELGPERHCRDLDDSLVVVMALLLDPDAALPAPAAEPATEPKQAPRDPAPALDLLGHAGVGVLVGPLPGPAGALALGVGVGRMPSWLVDLTLLTTMPVWTGGDEGRAHFRLHAGELAGCHYLASEARLRMGVCLGVQAGLMSGARQQLEHTSSSRLPYVSAAGRARAALQLLDALWLELDGGIAAALVRPAFSVTALDPETLRLERRELWRALPWALSAGSRLVVLF